MGAAVERALKFIESVGPVFPPFTRTSWWLAEEAIGGGIDRYAELLSVNGHALMLLERKGEAFTVSLYWHPTPLVPEHLGEENRKMLVEEWSTVSERLVRAVPMLGDAERGMEEGFLYYRAKASKEEELAHLIGAARSVAGLVPMTEPPIEEVAGSKVDLHEFLAPFLEEIVTLAAEEWDFLFDLVKNDLFFRIGIREASGTYGYPRSSFHRYVKLLEQYGVVLACREDTKEGFKRHRYYANLRHEHVLMYYMGILPEMDPESGPRGVCALLPYLEGLRHRHWHVFPGPYARCREISMKLREQEPVITRRPC